MKCPNVDCDGELADVSVRRLNHTDTVRHLAKCPKCHDFHIYLTEVATAAALNAATAPYDDRDQT